jgi:hypothetical protein
MTAIDDRLAGCFANAFPELAPEEFASAAADTVTEWDSLRAVVCSRRRSTFGSPHTTTRSCARMRR